MVSFTYLALLASSVLGAVAAPAAEPAGADLPDFEFNIEARNLTRRQDYNQNWKGGGGSVQYSATSNGYSVTFSGAGDFVVGKGWRTGSASRTIKYQGNTQAQAGTVLLSVYGWSRNPLVEYYVQQYTSNGQGSAQGQKLGTYESDGATYEIWKHQQVNQPSIEGTSTFWQYISNRVSGSAPTSGTVTMANHINAWKQHGLDLGQLDYQVLATEGWGGASGSSSYTISG
ncbi:403c52a1-8efe-4088-be7d-5e84586f474d [Thermothielavioides terrestris]|uniref:Endo-1,4-beta-xylanase n=1 Tax=Thermothielavioides terrestris TaxID=2587410 RepID=A0A3S4BJ41_9PEZI|nr:403c52a1-8efe-4088-be7d-5e84586f474d [Thermothielavioides terrestris]